MRTLVFVSLLSLFILVVAHEEDHNDDLPCYNKEDHNEDHTGYFETIRLHTLTAGTTIAQATEAIDKYLDYVIESKKAIVTKLNFLLGDDVIEYFGFYDDASSTYVTCATWRTEAGAQASFDYGTSNAPYSQQLTLVQSFNGNITNFLEVLEIHSASERSYFKGVRIANLLQPSIWNDTNIPPIIRTGLLPQLKVHQLSIV